MGFEATSYRSSLKFNGDAGRGNPWRHNYLFILCTEILAILIKRNKDIKGIFVYDK